jgi:hypothetical protein
MGHFGAGPTEPATLGPRPKAAQHYSEFFFFQGFHFSDIKFPGNGVNF